MRRLASLPVTRGTRIWYCQRSWSVPRGVAPVADRLEIRGGSPPGPSPRIPQVAPNPIEQVDVLRRTAQIPGRTPRIARFVIAVRRIVRDPGVAGRSAAG